MTVEGKLRKKELACSLDFHRPATSRCSLGFGNRGGVSIRRAAGHFLLSPRGRGEKMTCRSPNFLFPSPRNDGTQVPRVLFAVRPG